MDVSVKPPKQADEIHIFISYSSEDVELAEALEAGLSGPPYNLKVARDKTFLKPGDHVDFAIPEELTKAKAVIILWSDAAAKSDWVRHEASYAQVVGKALTLSVAGFDHDQLPSVYKSLHCGEYNAIMRDPAPLLDKLREINEAAKPPPPALKDLKKLPRMSNKFIARSTELRLLMDAWSAGAPNLISLIAAGGTGKTALAQAFLDEMALADWGGAEAVYAFSFDSQGTDEKRQGSSDRFFYEALIFFGEDPATMKSAKKRAARLAEIMEQRRVLLILDGIEPMQSPRGDEEHGRLRDDAFAGFLSDMARTNMGLCVVTSRLQLVDLARHRPEQYREIALRNMPLGDAVEMLRSFNIAFSQAELETLASEFGRIVETPVEPGTVSAPEQKDPPETGPLIRCHAKAIALIGSYMKRRFAGARLAPTLAEIREAFHVPPEAFLGKPDAALKDEPGYAVYKMVRRYEILYEDAAGAETKALVATAPGRQLLLLRIMGLFDRPAPWNAFEAVLAAPQIEGLTERLGDVSPGEWQEALNGLRADGLMNPALGGDGVLAPGHMLDAHPLIRDYFSRRLAAVAPDAFRAAHKRLYDHYRFQRLPHAFRDPVAYGVLALCAEFPHARKYLPTIKDLGHWPDEMENVLPTVLRNAAWHQVQAAIALIDGPDWREAIETFLPADETAMIPLFTAIAHGCAAGRQHDVFYEVYWPRIMRGDRYFSTKMLGLYGSDLSALAHFFDSPFDCPTQSLSATQQAMILGDVGYGLQALGRLADAAAPLFEAKRRHAAQRNWQGAAIATSNLSELLLNLGRLHDDPAQGLKGALSQARSAVSHADNSKNAFMALERRSVLANALLQSGDWGGAAQRFSEVEQLQRQCNPEQPIFGSMLAFVLGQLRLVQGRVSEVKARAAFALNNAQAAAEEDLLDVSLSRLALGQAAFASALAAGGDSPLWGEAESYFDQALEDLREAGTLVFSPFGFLARAAFYRTTGQAASAAKDLAFVFDIAERSGMKLFLAECWLERARQDLTQVRPVAATRTPRCTSAHKAFEQAGRIISDCGYDRRKPDMILIGAELALACGDRATGSTMLDQLIGIVFSHNLWGFLPEIKRLTAAHDLTDIKAHLPQLDSQRAHYDEAADTAFELARTPVYADGLDDTVIDARLADPVFLKTLNQSIIASGYKPLDQALIEKQRDFARAYIRQVERKQGT